MTARSIPRVRVGISACLLGQRVRYDGGHKLDRRVAGPLGRLFEWIPVCPEVELGLGVPRETLRLEGDPRRPRLVFERARRDITSRMRAWSLRRLEQLDLLDLCGYILKSRSPTCGLRSVPVHRTGRPGAPPARRGSGVFARALRARFPRLPVEEEDALHDRARRERFVRRVLAYRRKLDRLADGAARARASGGRA
jgi:uncharacterized protein YbbK (DUF523 family)